MRLSLPAQYIAVAIRSWDYPISAEARVERTLYTLLAILIGCVITVLIETVFAKKNPPDAVLEGISRRLNLIETLLSQASAAEFPSSALTIQLGRSAAKGVDDLRELPRNIPAMTRAFAICSRR